MGGFISNQAVLKLALSILLRSLTRLARDELRVAIRNWYRGTLVTESTQDVAVARSVAYVFGINVADIDAEAEAALIAEID
jgi:hypothetical protein